MKYYKGEVTDFQDNQLDSETGPYLPPLLSIVALVTHTFPLMSYMRTAHGLVSAGPFLCRQFLPETFVQLACPYPLHYIDLNKNQ